MKVVVQKHAEYFLKNIKFCTLEASEYFKKTS